MILAILEGGKYFARKALARRSQVIMEAGGWELGHAFALSLSINGNSLSRMASSDIP